MLFDCAYNCVIKLHRIHPYFRQKNPAFDQSRIPVFNTNTFVLDAASIDADFPLTWFAVQKTVDGRPAIQFERLVGELTAFVDSAFLRVERHGPDARFQPIKTPDDMDKERPDIVAALRARGSL